MMHGPIRIRFKLIMYFSTNKHLIYFQNFFDLLFRPASERIKSIFRRFRKITNSFVMSVCPYVLPSVRMPTTRLPLDGFSLKSVFLKNLSRKFNFHSNLTRITDTLREDRCIFFLSHLAQFLVRECFRQKL